MRRVQLASMKSPTHPLRRLWGYSTAYRRNIILASLWSVLNLIFDLMPPFLIGAAVDIVVARENSILASFGVPDVTMQLWILAGLTFIIWSFESAFQYAYSVTWRNLAQSIEHDLRMEAYAHVQGLEMAYFEDRSTGGLLSILNDDINQLERFLDNGANEILHLFTTMIVIGTVFFAAAPSVAWMTVLPMPFIIWGSIRYQRLLAPLYSRVREQVGLLNGQLANNLSGIATIKSFTAEHFEVGRIRKESQAYRERNREAITLSSAFVPLIRMVIVVGFISILVFGGQLALNGDLNIGLYSVLIFITQRLLWPLTRLGETLDLYQRAMASTARVLDLLDTKPGIESGSQVLAVKATTGHVRLNDVSFEYGSQNGRSVLQGLSLDISAGQTIGLVGLTGAGKTTVVKLLLRFYDVQSGQITLDGIDIRELNLSDLRRAIGFVSQDVFLFHGTVRENIAYGSFDASLEEFTAAAQTAEAHEFILELPEGYDTIVGERGQKLSGGQRQRISLARAVLKDPPVLVLDEATSSVDNETEAAIQRSLERIVKNRTTIVIAHRLSTIRNADRIYVLEKGRLHEQGDHAALLAQNGIYASLWGVQTGAVESFSAM